MAIVIARRDLWSLSAVRRGGVVQPMEREISPPVYWLVDGGEQRMRVCFASVQNFFFFLLVVFLCLFPHPVRDGGVS